MTTTDGAAECLHVEHLRVAWVDTDASGRIHWSSVFRWAELAEHRFLSRLGRDRDDTGSYPRRAAAVTYHRALEFDDRFEVRLSVEKAGGTSVTFGWRIVRGDELCVDGRHTVVHVGDDGRPSRWPEYLRAGLDPEAPPSDAETA
jgi:YbgC/YbaW family acyl-CoA thioester hydrolase